jgi:hypothetical protein
MARVGEKTNACQVTAGIGRSSGKYENTVEMELKKYYIMVWGG